MDTFFISHGSPTISIDETMLARHFFQSWKTQHFPTDPKAVLMVSAHWDTAELAVNIIDGTNDTIHDFNNFPRPMYEIKYPTPGAPKLAKRVKELLVNAGFDNVEEDRTRGLDHGAWVPLMFMYPEANIPVCQLSIQSSKDGTYHYNVGKALAPLREEGVLIIGSGSATHNLSLLGPEHVPPPSWAVEFDKWLTESLLGRRHEDVKHYEEKALVPKPHILGRTTSFLTCCSWCRRRERKGRADTS
ncbi:hypothetical protein HPP92_017991 [Vanilla planifolia]|uniref:Extradiol ring-cleavage dioxygenase class III enzyme subunit B domain-containing protein n=1 Tax=Vanilla planifolia TaxID=51239 RepID=A0A835Q925_VANPL|nr:hypothetical protein HPP92_017991 [Vanilla planifolia]